MGTCSSSRGCNHDSSHTTGTWRDQILREFAPDVARLTLIAGPDGLLAEESVITILRQRGFDLITFDDPITFRYVYEAKYRSRWDRGDLDALYHAQRQHNPEKLGSNATRDFILRHVFESSAELMQHPSDLLRSLLRRHYQGQHIPSPLDERFIQVVRQNTSFVIWPWESIVPNRQAFFAFLQERWPIFLERLTANHAAGVHEREVSYSLGKR